MKQHWVNYYLNKPYSPHGKGPDSFDCWGLIWHVKLHIQKILLPRMEEYLAKNIGEFSKAYKNETKNWIRLDSPQELCIVALGKSINICHCGVVVEGLVLHSTESVGVRLDSFSDIKKKYKKIEFLECQK